MLLVVISGSFDYIDGISIGRTEKKNIISITHKKNVDKCEFKE